MNQQREEIKITEKTLDATNRTLQLTQEQLELTKDELEISNKEFKQQNTTLKRQRFESTFFNYVNIHLKNVEQVTYKTESGAHAFSTFNREFIHHYSVHNKVSKPSDIIRSFEQHSFDHPIRYAPYLKSLIQLHKLVKFKNKKVSKRYYDVISSLMTIEEKRFLIYVMKLSNNKTVLEAIDEGLKITKELIEVGYYDSAISFHFR